MAALAEVYVPGFDLMLGGQPVPAELRALISSVRLEQSLQGADRVEIQFADPGLTLLSSPMMDLKVPIELTLGYLPTGLRFVFMGNVTAVEPSFPTNGMPSITLTAHDFLERLTEGTKDRCFPHYIPDAVIATIVAAENLLISPPDLETLAVTSALAVLGHFTERPTRYQHNVSDHDFLRKIAADYGIEMWVDGHVLNFKLLAPGLPAPQVELTWGESLIDFSARLSSIGQIAAVRATVYVEALKTQLGVEISWDGDRLSARVVPAAFQLGTGVAVVLPDIPMDSPVEAIRRAIAEMKRRVNNRLTGHGTCVGDPRVKAGDVITISKVGKFGGANYRITSATHTLDSSGYKTNFEVRQEWI